MLIPTYQQLLDENKVLHTRLKEADDALSAIQQGEVDALIVSTVQGKQVYTLQGADHPYRLLIEKMQQGAVTVSDDGVILYVNHYFCEFLGRSSTDLISHYIEDYLVSSERPRFRLFLQRLRTESGMAEEFRFQNLHQQVIPTYLLINSIVIEQTNLIYIVVIDIRQRKQIEQQALDLEIERQRVKLLADFMRYMSHDFRTPLTIIVTALYIIQHSHDEKRKLEKCAEIEKQVFYLSGALDQFKEMVRLDSLDTLPLQAGEINDLILNVVQTHYEEACLRSISISVEITPHPLKVRFDPVSMRNTIDELVTNAVRFAPTGGHIHVRYDSSMDGYSLLEISNDGDGIAPDKLPHIFEKQYKGDESRSQHLSLGLGLSMVKRIIELHQGTIEVESVPGVLTYFRISLPLLLDH